MPTYRSAYTSFPLPIISLWYFVLILYECEKSRFVASIRFYKPEGLLHVSKSQVRPVGGVVDGGVQLIYDSDLWDCRILQVAEASNPWPAFVRFMSYGCPLPVRLTISFRLESNFLCSILPRWFIHDTNAYGGFSLSLIDLSLAVCRRKTKKRWRTLNPKIRYKPNPFSWFCYFFWLLLICNTSPRSRRCIFYGNAGSGSDERHDSTYGWPISTRPSE